MSKISMLAIMLNIKEELIQDLQETVHSDNSITRKIKLRVINPNCPYCKNEPRFMAIFREN